MAMNESVNLTQRSDIRVKLRKLKAGMLEISFVNNARATIVCSKNNIAFVDGKYGYRKIIMI